MPAADPHAPSFCSLVRSLIVVSLALAPVALARLVGAQAPIPLRIDPAGAHQAQVRSSAGEVQVSTEGTDPFVFCAPVEKAFDSARYRVLSFEYSSPAGLDSFEVFYGPPIRAGIAATGGALAATAGGAFRSFAVDLIDAGRGWASHRRLRLDFGKLPGARVRVRNLVLRAPNAIEWGRIERRRLAAAADRRRANWTGTYLGGDFPAQIESVQVEPDSVRVIGQGGGRGDRLCEFRPQDHLADGLTAYPNWALEPEPGGQFEVRLPRRTASGRDRARSRFAVVRAQTLRSHAVFPTKFTTPPGLRQRRSKPRSIKGLGGVSWRREKMDDLTALGVHNITINLSLPQILRLNPTADSQRFRFEGETYHVHRPALRQADRTLAFAARHELIVSAILLIPRRLGDGALRRAFVHPDASAPGIYSMANLTSAAGDQAFAAAMTFLARRYGAGQSRRIHNWIVHNEVDAGWVWTNAGKKSLQTYVELYHRVLRATYAVVRMSDPMARVFVSLTHHFATTPRPRFYPGRAVLETLATLTQREGEFEWGVAYHPYPESLREPRSWRDRQSLFGFDTPMITFRNIEVLDAFLRQRRFLYRGQTMRGVLLSEQGVDSGDGSAASLRLQAAGLAYAWLKVRGVPCVEAFHYHRWIDHEREGGLRLGLWSVVPGSVTEPRARKPAWHLYRRLGTDQEAASWAPFLPLIGVERGEQVRYTGSISEGR